MSVEDRARAVENVSAALTRDLLAEIEALRFTLEGIAWRLEKGKLDDETAATWARRIRKTLGNPDPTHG